MVQNGALVVTLWTCYSTL